jgi:hypothetical protein
MIALLQRLRSLPLGAVHFVQVPVVTYPPNPNWVQWSGDASKLFLAIAHDKKLPRTRHHHHHRHARNGGGVAASGSHSSASASPRPSASGKTRPHSPLSRVNRQYGGITAGANVCRDSGAFAGPLGGH